MTALKRWIGVVAIASAAAPSVAQVACFVRGNAVVRLVDARGSRVVGGCAAPVQLAAGPLAVHFAADALGKPRSLAFDVGEGDVVRIAVRAAAPAFHRVVAGRDLRAWAPNLPLRVVPQADGDAVRVAVTWTTIPATGGCGPATRIAADGSHYRGIWNAAADEWQLVRRMGADEFVIGRAKGAVAPTRNSVVTLQADGFRLQLECDDAVVLQAFDGALDRGDVGAWVPPDAEPAEVAVGVPAQPCVSAALVESGRSVRLQVATTASPDSWAVVEYVLDRPDALQPAIAWLPWRGSVGFGPVEPFGRDGVAVAGLRLPECLGLQAVSARALVVDAAGERVLQRSPAVAVTPRALVD